MKLRSPQSIENWAICILLDKLSIKLLKVCQSRSDIVYHYGIHLLLNAQLAINDFFCFRCHSNPNTSIIEIDAI